MIRRLFLDEQSVIRRSVGLYIFFLPALGFNFLLIYYASHILSEAIFGIFYTSLSMINVLIAPIFVLNVFFARYFSRIYATEGMRGMASHFTYVQRKLLCWGLPAAIVTF